MSKRSLLIIFIVLMFITSTADAREQNSVPTLQASASHDIVIEAVSWISYPIVCSTGDTLSGEFRVVGSGELFPGDQTKYDNWLLDGIDFLVLDEENYDLWIEESVVSPIIEGYSLTQLDWIVEIPNNGVWYVIYFNDSIYRIEIEGRIVRSGSNSILTPIIGFVGVTILLACFVVYWRKK